MLVQVITLTLLTLRENTAKSIVVAVFEATRDFRCNIARRVANPARYLPLQTDR